MGLVRVLAILTAIAATAACSDPETAAPATTSREVVNDTSVVTSRGTPPTYRVDSLEVFWSSPELNRPQQIGATSRKLVVGDRDRLHVVDLLNHEARTVGRGGEGPGEYRIIALATAWVADSIAVYDGILHRLSVLTPDGEYARSARIRPVFPYMNQRRSSNVVVPTGKGLFWLVTTNMDSREEVSTHSAISQVDFEADSSSIVQEWADLHYMSIGMRFVAPRTLFVEEVPVALSPTGLVAVGDGLDYCFSVWRISEDLLANAQPRRICREWQRAQVGPGASNPDFSEVPVPAETRATLYEVHAKQKLPERAPSFDRIRIDSEDRIWVRTISQQVADVHPTVLAWLPEKGPAYRAWDVFDEDGTLLATVEMPMRFIPDVIRPDRAFGKLELESGEVTVGVARLPQIQRLPRASGQ